MISEELAECSQYKQATEPKKSQSYGAPYWYQGREKETIA